VSFTLVDGLNLSGGVQLAATIALIEIVGLGVVLGYHRVLTHRACTLHPLVEKALITLACPAGTPVQWIGNHRHHHAVSDTPDDQHSPVQYGFWTAHAGWYLETRKTLPAILYTFAGPARMLFDAFWRPRTNQQHVHLAKDVADDRYYAFLSTKLGYALVMLTYLAVLYAGTWALFGIDALPWTVAAHVFTYAAGDLVNSACHGKHGRARWASGDESRNLWLLGVVALGDGFHNGHHAFPSSVRCGFGAAEPDAAYWIARALEALGLARDLKTPSERAMAKRALTTTTREEPC
jgi:stearoyl-CoA desaturase (delta-9 desaturase)